MEHVSTGTLITILVIMVIVSAYFSASETGMMTLNRYRLRHLSKQGSRSARRVEKLLKHPDRLISLVLIGNNLVNILASALATIVGIRLYGNAGVAIATGVLTFVVLVFAEVLPKTFCRAQSRKSRFPKQCVIAAAAKNHDAVSLVSKRHYTHSAAHVWDPSHSASKRRSE